MCELLGMSASFPSDLKGSLGLFGPRGGKSAPHGDGWGLAYYEHRAARVFKEAAAAATSGCLKFIAGQEYVSEIAIAHLRKANPPDTGRSIANTHPFHRELFGRSIVFAHNGILPGVFDLPLGRFRPLGETDSEWAFCYLLDRLAEHPEIFAPEKRSLLRSILNETAGKLSALGKFNFLLSEGRHLFAYGHTSLFSVDRACRMDGCNQRVVLVATEPLTDFEDWKKLPADRVAVFRRGLEVPNAPIGARRPGRGRHEGAVSAR